MLTKRDLLRSAALAAITASTAHSIPANAQAKAEWPDIREAKAIAEEGFIFGLPIVMNYAVMYEYSVDRNSGQFKAPFNQIKNEARVFTYKDTSIVTPNSDTPYSFLWMDLRSEPMVLSVPAVEKSRYYAVQLEDGNTYNYGYIGSRATGTEPGDYMVVGPDWKGTTPSGHQEGISIHHTVLGRGLSDSAFRCRRHAQCGEGPGGLQSTTALGLFEATGHGCFGRGGLSQGRQGDGEEKLL